MLNGKTIHVGGVERKPVKVINKDIDDLKQALRYVGKSLVRPVAMATVAVGVVGLTVGGVGLAVGAVAGGVALVVGSLGVILGGNKLARTLARWAA